MRRGSFLFLAIVLCLTTQTLGQTCNNPANICPKCKPNELQFGGECNTCDIGNCLLCSFEDLANSNTTVCDICVEGYTLSSDSSSCEELCPVSVLENPPVESCNCPSTVFNSDGLCSFCNVKNCILCDLKDQNKCDFCIADYKPSDDYTTCQQICTIRAPSSCKCTPKQSNVAGVCRTCKVKNCLLCSHNNQNVCDKCNGGFRYLNNGASCDVCSASLCTTCAANSATDCDVCFDGFTLNSTTKKCGVPTCSGQLIYNGNKCICPLNTYEVAGSLCTNCPSNCDNCGTTGCTKCLSGFYLSNKICQQCLANCLQCSNGTSCNQCTSGYTYSSSNKICQSVPADVGGIFIIVVIQSDGTTSNAQAACEGSCIECSGPYLCTKCPVGKFIKNGKCKLCSANCKTCSQNDKHFCTTCYPGLILSSANQCITCPENCFQCINKDYCISCETGFYSKQGVCTICPLNCLVCNGGSSGCTKCSIGYGALGTNCAPCLTGCSLCGLPDIADCKKCVDGYYQSSAIVNSVNKKLCSKCPTGCSTCSSASVCASCSIGFSFNSGDKKCYKSCKFPCSTCTNGKPTECLSCFAGYSRQGTLCATSTTCNDRADCLACPKGFALMQRKCEQCSLPFTSCNGCSSDDKNVCSSCLSGFYLTETSCKSCPNKCSSCQSQSFCKQCKDGFYMKTKNNEPTGTCKACDASYYCATCEKQSTLCTSCISGYTIQEQSCISNKRVTSKIVLVITYQSFQSQYYIFLLAFAKLLGPIYQNNLQLINIKGLSSGSTVISLLVSTPPGSTDTASISNNLEANLVTGAKIGDLQLESPAEVEVTEVVNPTDPTDPTDPTPTTPDQAPSANLGLILGLSIPLGVIALVVLFIFMKASGKKETNSDGLNSENKLMHLEEI